MPRSQLTISAALWCLALMVPIQFSLFALIGSLGPGIPGWLVILFGIGVNLLLFGALPGLFAYLGRLDMADALGLQAPRPAALVAGVLLGISLWPLELRLMAEGGLTQGMQDRLGQVVDTFKQAQQTVGMGVYAMVIVPAILEEIYFRGLLWSAYAARGARG